MIELKKGQRITLSAIGLGNNFSVLFSEKTGNKNVDISVFVTDDNKKIISDNYIIFYGHKKSPCLSVNLESDAAGNSVFIDIDKLPIEAKHIYICLTLDGVPVSSLQDAILSFFTDEFTYTAHFRLPLSELAQERSLIIAELYKKNEWRCACVAQGFVHGALEYLVPHFGGEVLEEPTPPPVEPALDLRVLLDKSRYDAHFAAPNAIQQYVDAQKTDIVVLGAPHTEYEIKGPLFLQRDMTLTGNQVTLWAESAPTLYIGSCQVLLRDIVLEANSHPLTPLDRCALVVESGARLSCENVQILGTVLGISGEEGVWSYPTFLQLGTLGSAYAYNFTFEVLVPVQCSVKSNISGLHVSPSALVPGMNMVHIKLKSKTFFDDSRIYGAILLQTACFLRRIMVAGYVVNASTSNITAPSQTSIQLN